MTPLPTDALGLTIFLYRHLLSREVCERQVIGVLPASFDFSEVEARLDNDNLLVSSDAKLLKIEFALPSNFFLSFDELISTAERRIASPSKFYLADTHCLYEGDTATLPAVAQHYIAATQLYSTLGNAADHTGGLGSTKTLIFLQKGKLEIIPDYIETDLRELSSANHFKSEFIESATHKDQKQTIVRTVLFELFQGRGRVPFSELLEQFDDFIEKLNASYQLYVSEFSFQKVKAEVEREKLEATTKLNKVFSDIQNQLLAVPAALILVGGQMVNESSWSSKNVLIWLGTLVFSVIMTLLVRNQRHTLLAVKQEIDQQWQQIKGKPHSVADRFESSYRQLDIRYDHQVWLLRIVSFLVAISLAAATGMLLWFSVSQQLLIESATWGVWFALPLMAWDILRWALIKYLSESSKDRLRQIIPFLDLTK